MCHIEDNPVVHNQVHKKNTILYMCSMQRRNGDGGAVDKASSEA